MYKRLDCAIRARVEGRSVWMWRLPPWYLPESRRNHRPGQQRHEGALVRQVSMAEELAESATGAPVGKVPPVERMQRVRHQSISRGRLEPGVEQEGFRGPALRRTAKQNISWVEGAPSNAIAQTPPIESAAKESASAKETPIGGAPREPVSPRNLICGRQP